MPAKRGKKNAQLGLCDNWSGLRRKLFYQTTKNHCGSEPAREYGASGNVDVD
jgi:hypothetical protein